MNSPEQEILDKLKSLQRGVRTDKLAGLVTRCRKTVKDLTSHEIPCYCRALLEWDHGGRKGEQPHL